MSGQNIMSCVLRVYDYRSSPNTECCMSGQSSKVKWPIPAPDGTFPLLDEGGVKKQVQTWYILTEECILGNVKGQTVLQWVCDREDYKVKMKIIKDQCCQLVSRLCMLFMTVGMLQLTSPCKLHRWRIKRKPWVNEWIKIMKLPRSIVWKWVICFGPCSHQISTQLQDHHQNTEWESIL